MIAALQKLKPHYQLHYYSFNIDGFRSSIPNHSEKLRAIDKKIKPFNWWCTRPPPKEVPSDLTDFLVFHGSSAFLIFQWIQKQVPNLSFEDVPKELRTLTDYFKEFDLIMGVRFDFAWHGMLYPIIRDQPRLLTFRDVSVWDIYEGEWRKLASDESDGSNDEFRSQMT
jgi:hypothetical protein